MHIADTPRNDEQVIRNSSGCGYIRLSYQNLFPIEQIAQGKAPIVPIECDGNGYYRGTYDMRKGFLAYDVTRQWHAKHPR